MPASQIEVGGIVLAGGQSSRMGREKALLEWEGETLVQRAVRLLQMACREVLVVTASEAVRRAVSVPTVADEKPGRGPLGGLYTGLRAAAQEYNYVVACDMPWISPEGIRCLAQWAVPDYQAVALRRGERWEPLPALFSVRCLPVLETCLADGTWKLAQVYDRLPTRPVTEAEWRRFDPELRALGNLNTPEDYAHALLLRGSLP